MNTKTGFTIITLLLLVIIAGLGILIFVPGPSQQPSDSPIGAQAKLDDLITVSAPLINATVSSPLTVTGQARGTWYFEASAPVTLLDAKGKTIVQTHMEAQSDWMTTDFVPFKAVITFPPQPKGSIGTLVFENDNPSGDPSRQKELRVPVKF